MQSASWKSATSSITRKSTGQRVPDALGSPWPMRRKRLFFTRKAEPSVPAPTRLSVACCRNIISCEAGFPSHASCTPFICRQFSCFRVFRLLDICCVESSSALRTAVAPYWAIHFCRIERPMLTIFLRVFRFLALLLLPPLVFSAPQEVFSQQLDIDRADF